MVSCEQQWGKKPFNRILFTHTLFTPQRHRHQTQASNSRHVLMHNLATQPHLQQQGSLLLMSIFHLHFAHIHEMYTHGLFNIQESILKMINTI